MPPLPRTIRLGFFTTADSVLFRRLYSGMFAFARATPGVQIAHLKSPLGATGASFQALRFDGVLVTSKRSYESLGAPGVPSICVGSADAFCPILRICDD